MKRSTGSSLAPRAPSRSPSRVLPSAFRSGRTLLRFCSGIAYEHFGIRRVVDGGERGTGRWESIALRCALGVRRGIRLAGESFRPSGALWV